jgi:hypothetical protein
MAKKTKHKRCCFVCGKRAKRWFLWEPAEGMEQEKSPCCKSCAGKMLMRMNLDGIIPRVSA